MISSGSQANRFHDGRGDGVVSAAGVGCLRVPVAAGCGDFALVGLAYHLVFRSNTGDAREESWRWSRYSVLIQWSDEDRADLMTLPEWIGRIRNPVTHGDTHEVVGHNGREVLEMLIEDATETGQPQPLPRVFASVRSGRVRLA